MKIVKVTWIDAQRIELGVLGLAEIKNLNPLHCEIVGFQLQRDKNKIVIAQELWQDDIGAKYVNVIPMRSVVSVEELVVKK